jgi:hypothetical protein
MHRIAPPRAYGGLPSIIIANYLTVISAAILSEISKMAVDQPFPRGTFKVELGSAEHEVSVIFKPTQSTIMFFIIRPGELAKEHQVHHTRPGRFGRFDETEVVEAARELALAFVEKVRSR